MQNNSKEIIVELDDTGILVGVYCPDETYNVNVLDGVAREMENSKEIQRYYDDLEKEKQNLKNMY